MGTIVGLLLGAGVFSLWWSWWPREKPLRVPNTLIRKLSEELTQAGLHAVAPSALFGASLVSALSAFLVLYAVSQTTSIALAFAVIAAGVPMAVVRHRARTRRRTTRDLWPEAVDHLVSGVRARPSPRSPRTTGLPGDSCRAWTGSRTSWRTRWPTGSSNRYG